MWRRSEPWIVENNSRAKKNPQGLNGGLGLEGIKEQQ
jgi:hypothetical protein